MGWGLCEGGSEEGVARVLARCRPGGGSNGWGRGGAPGRRIAGGQWSVVLARETRRRPRRLARGLARNNCAWGSEALCAWIGENRYGADLSRAPGGFPNRRWTRVHTSVETGAEHAGRFIG